ncbi:MAG: hypothetical protein EU541_00280 [Promethearchaeota archaeon]|nr:MAG: hypothetical protein EU541_00280 [Candidatus Lokiarchaeota archaeon]
MTSIRFECTCGEIITYEIDPKSIETELNLSSIVPILVSHNDHFVTVYVDKNYNVRGIERIILVKDNESSVVVKTKMPQAEIIKKVEKIKAKKDPSKEFLAFLSLLLSEIQEPENLFIAGKKIGHYLWNKRREPVIKLGASFKIDPKLVLKNEIAPIFKNISDIEDIKSEDKTIVIKDTISPQFIIGIAQGIINAISEYMEKKFNIVLEYVMSGETVFLTLKDS